MNVLAIDIETMPNEEMISKLPEVIADSRLKDEAKIQADIEKKKQEQVEKMALSPLYGKIACIGYYGFDIKEVDLRDEKSMIETLLKRIEEDYLFVTWNGNKFDFDFIFKRGVILGICPLYLLEKYTNKQSYPIHIDLMEKWCGYGKYLKLNEVASILLDEQKEDFDVKEIPELIKSVEGQELIKRYCLQDCKLTFKLAKKMGY